MQVLDGQISTYFNKETCDLVMLCILLECQLLSCIIVIVVQFIIHLCSTFIPCLIILPMRIYILKIITMNNVNL
jgi:hypothetical protein